MGLLLDVLYIIAGIIAFPWYYLRLKRTGRGLDQIWARLKAPPRFDTTRYRIWIHAVSVGEVLAAVPLTDMLYEVLPSDIELALSVSTTSGMEMAQQKMPHVPAFYCPPDLSLLVKRAFRRAEPAILVLMELELWPNMLREAARRKIPVLVVNGRISERSAKGYAKLGWFFRRMARRVSMFGVQNHTYARRLLDLQIPQERVVILGNVKYDLALKPPPDAKVRYLRRVIGAGKGTKVFLAGSTHPGEEEIVADVYRRLKKDVPDLKLVLVPRHPGRSGEVSAALADIPHVLRSEVEKGASTDGKAVIGDVMGELSALYYASSVVFVGGSMIEHGGQNPLEPAAAGRPMVVGPHMFNFASEIKLLKEAGAAVEVAGADDMYRVLSGWLADEAAASKAGLAGRQAIVSHKGAAARYAEVIRKYLAENMEVA
ncbi:MAG: 3-deoxy-D-manno-octulosonic acid transferase [Planctomycetes bacterium]|nr:3-deoxy-D-manno-octulosonic acid transferase [Planctomycetota bacterium]